MSYIASHSVLAAATHYIQSHSTSTCQEITSTKKKHTYLDRGGIVAQVFLVCHQNDGNIRAEVLYLWVPFFEYILQRIGRVNGETHQNYIRVRIGQGTKAIVVLLSRGIPQRELDLKATQKPNNVINNQRRQVTTAKSLKLSYYTAKRSAKENTICQDVL